MILSSYGVPQLPVYSYEPPPPIDDTDTNQQRGRTAAPAERDQSRPLRYYPGEGNPQIPPVWNTVRMSELEEVHARIHRERRNSRSRSSRQYSPDQTRRTPAEGTWNIAPFRRVYLWFWPQFRKKKHFKDLFASMSHAHYSQACFSIYWKYSLLIS